MADDKNLIINIRAKTDTFNKRLKEAKSETEKLQKNLSSLTKRSAAGFAVVSAAIGGVAVSFGRFQKDFSQVVTLLDKSSFATKTLKQGTDDLRKGILDLRAASGESFQDLNKGLFDLISAGIPAEKAMTTLATATNLAAAGGTNVATAVDALTTSISAFGLEAEDAERVSQLFFLAQKNGKTTVGELANSMGVVASSAASFGVSLEEVLAASAATTLAGKSTSQAMTGLNQVFANIAKPTKDAAEEADRLGIQFDSAGLRAKGLSGFLNDIVTAEGFTTASIEKLFGSVEAMGVAFALTGEQNQAFTDTLSQLNDEAALAKTFNDALTEANNTQAKAWAKMTGAIQAVVTLIGAELAPLVIAVANKITDFAKAILNADSSVIRAIKNFLVFTAGVTGLTAVIGGLGIAILALRTGLKALGVQALLTNKHMLAFGAGLFKVTGITKAFTAVSALTTSALKAMGLAGAGAWKKILLPVAAGIAAYKSLRFAIEKVGAALGISAETSEKSLQRVKNKIVDLREQEQKLQDKVKNGFEFRKAANQAKLDDIQKEIAQSEALQAVIQREVDLRNEVSASKSMPLASGGEGGDVAAPEVGMEAQATEAPVDTERTDAIINERIRETELKVAEAERERELLKAARDGATEEELASIAEKNALIAEQEQLKLEEDLLREELRAEQKGSKREAEIEAELEHNAIQQENLKLHLEEMEAVRMEDEELQKERQNEFDLLSDERRQNRSQAEIDALTNELKTKEQLKIQNAKRDAQRINRENARFLETQRKHGTAVAKIEKAFNNEKVNNARKTGAQLAQLAQSENSKLKAIGKAAALVNIGIDTAKGAIAAYTSLAGIPFVGPVLGAAAAAAVIAFGVEQTAKVSAANKGGMVTGGITGVDTEPFLLSRGESVIPADVTPTLLNTFEQLRDIKSNGGLLNTIAQETITQPTIQTDTVINDKEVIATSVESAQEEAEPQQVNINIDIEEDAVDFITAQQRENESLSIGTI